MRCKQPVLPETVVDRCRLVSRRLGLTLAGIDLIHHPHGEWYFLEANTSPAFTFFSAHELVAAAVAEVLIEGSPPHPY